MFSLIGATGTSISWLDNLMSSVLGILTLDMMLYIFGGIMLAIILGNTIGLIWSYEEKSMRAIKRINKYLQSNSSINDSNLVEFNKRMKKLPTRIRERWQLFMLERVGSPSRYLSVEYCVKRPLYNSSVLQSIHQVKYITIILAIVSLVMSFAVVGYSDVANTLGLAGVLSSSLTIPCIMAVFGVAYCMILQVRFKYLNRDFYDVFTIFVRNIDKATNTMPDYVDYELLFTKKEIEAGIPVLREYLEKKALEEQRLLEKAKREEANHSPYNFEDLGINGSQLIERAVDESEEFLTYKIQLQDEINGLEKQYQITEQNMDDMERDANKKLQAIKENLERLDKAISETSNRVEINYNRRQAKEEMDKRLLLEKELKAMLDKEKVAQDALRVEIEKRKEEIEKNKSGVEEALKAEYDTFATKVYDEIFQKVSQETADVIHDYEIQVSRLKAKLKEFNTDIEKKSSVIEAKTLELENLKAQNEKLQNKGKKPKDDVVKKSNDEEVISDFGNDAFNASHEAVDINTPNLINNIEGVEKGETVSNFNQYYDDNGNAIDYSKYLDENGNLVDYSQYYDENGNLIDYSQYYDENGNLKPEYASALPNGEQKNKDDNDGETGDDGAKVLKPASKETAKELPRKNIEPKTQNEEPQDNILTPPAVETKSSTVGEMEQQAKVEEQKVEVSKKPEIIENVAKKPESKIETQPSTMQNNSQVATGNTTGNGSETANKPVVQGPNPAYSFSNFDIDTLIDNGEDEKENYFTSNDNFEDDFIKKPTDKEPEIKETPKEENKPQEMNNWDYNGEKNNSSPLSMEKQDDVVVSWKNQEATKPKDDFIEIEKPVKHSTSAEKEEQEETDSQKSATKKKKMEEHEDKGEKKSTKSHTNDTEDLLNLQKQIAEENDKLKKQQEELRSQIDKTLSAMETKTDVTKSEKQKNIKKIKTLIDKLKVESKDAKARGASKAEISKINKSVAELLKVITKYQSGN